MPGSRLLERLGTIAADDEALARLSVDGTALRLRRAWPRKDGGLTLEYVAGEAIVAGQWLPAPASVRELTRHLGDGRASVAHVAGEAVMLQAPGADRMLSSLADAAADGRLLAHRAERRATVATPGAFVKVVPPGRAAQPAAAHRRASALAADVVIPGLLAVDDARGTLELAPLEGTALHELLGGPHEGGHLQAVGAALARFHASPPPTGAPHGPPEEAAVLRRWLNRLEPFDPELHACAERVAQPVLDALAGLGAMPRALLHGDLHDKQVFITPEGVGLIDLDTCSPGDPAVDVANLLVHLRLRAWQDGRDPAGDAARAALLDGYAARRSMHARLEVYERATALRLACVYAFRPRWGTSLPRLLLDAAAARRS